jgi:hypothetical protein
MKTATADLYEALRMKAGIVPAEQTKGTNQLKLLCRLQSDRLPNWKVVMHRLKKAELDADWSVDISKVFFLKNNSPHGMLVQGWRIIIKSVNLDASLADVARHVRNAPNARVELEEVALPGGGQHRNINTAGGKGAAPLSGSRGSGPSAGPR